MSARTYRQTYFDDSPRAPMTIEERENLHHEKPVSITAFQSRNVQKLATKRRPKSLSSIEINHKLRTYVPESIQTKPSDPFRLWVEAGRRAPPFPPRWEPDYNSNVWKNFSGVRGFTASRSAGTTRSHNTQVPELIADMYPVKIPSHSVMGERTFSKFLSEVPLIKDSKKRQRAIDRSQRELEEFKQLKLRSEMRVPPMTSRGEILPPAGFKKYIHARPVRMDSPEQTTSQSLRLMTELERDCERNVLGTHRSSPVRLWKLSFKDNHPDYDTVEAEKLELRRPGVVIKKHVSMSQAEILFK